MNESTGNTLAEVQTNRINKTEVAEAKIHNDPFFAMISISYGFDLSKALQYGYNLDEEFEIEPEMYRVYGEIEIEFDKAENLSDLRNEIDRRSWVSIIDIRSNNKDIGDMAGYEIDNPFFDIKDTEQYLNMLNKNFKYLDKYTSYQKITTLAVYETSDDIFQNVNLDIGTRFDENGYPHNLYYRSYTNEALNPGCSHRWKYLVNIEELMSQEVPGTIFHKILHNIFKKEYLAEWQPSLSDLGIHEEKE